MGTPNVLKLPHGNDLIMNSCFIITADPSYDVCELYCHVVMGTVAPPAITMRANVTTSTGWWFSISVSFSWEWVQYIVRHFGIS